MAYVGDQIRGAIGQAFNAMRDVFIESATTVKLLKQTANADTFTTIATLSDKWFFEYQAFRQQFVLQIADSSTTLTTNVNQATHVQLSDGAVYVITQADTVAPTANDFTWKIFCTKYTQAGQFRNLY